MRHRAEMRIVMTLLGVLIMAVLPVTGFGEVPHQINYQGYLTDDLGEPLEGDYVMLFSIYDVSTGGTTLWWEEQTVAVANGIFNVQMGQDPTGNPFPTDLFDGQRWLGVAVGLDAEMTPRQPLTSVAFALKAENADTLAGQTIDDLNTAFVNIGETDVVTSAMVAPNSLTADDLAANSVAAAEIVNGAVTTLEIANGTVTAVDLASDYVNTTGDTMTGPLELIDNLIMPATSSTTGIIRSGSSTLIHSYGTWNFFAGVSAGNLTMTGYDNTASGYSALYSNTTGSWNTASGSRALYSNTTGDNNTASGNRALYSNTTGRWNTASGYQALNFNTTGDNNTANGYYALYANITGSSNTASGYWALKSNTEGSHNAASGVFALYANTAGDDNTASGVDALYSNTDGDENTASGSSALRSNTTGIHGTAFGARAGYTNETGNGNTFIGCDSDATANNLINATALGYSAVVNGSNRVRIGNTYVSQIGGNVGWSNLSDIRGKEDIVDITLGLDFINSLRPVEFRLIEGNEGLDLGFIAQDVAALLGTAYNILGIGGDADRTLSLRYTDFIAPMVKAIQEQQEQIQEQQAYIKALEKRLSHIENQLGVSR